MLDRFLSRSRIRAAGRQLAKNPSARNYVSLAQAMAAVGRLEEVRRICDEGIALYPSNAELRRLLDRSGEIHRETRARYLQRALKDAPRPAIWRELCQVHLESGHFARAEEMASEWWAAMRDPEAMFFRAKARAERFLNDRRREDGRMAFQFAEEAGQLMPGDPRPLQLRLHLASRCGAWADARTTLARLLELFPGDPKLEARFRTVTSLQDRGTTIEQALREVELSGRLVDDATLAERQPAARSVRPLLQGLAAEHDVRGAFYVRGGTALVQGLRGATAERTARTVRELVNAGRSAARRLGLGQCYDVSLEGSFGVMLLKPGDVGAAAMWTQDMPTRKHREALAELTRVAESNLEVEA
jgi:hypothetical protein